MYINKKINKINFFSVLSIIVILIFIPTILVSNYYFSEITYFYGDNLLINFIHNISKDKKNFRYNRKYIQYKWHCNNTS